MNMFITTLVTIISHEISSQTHFKVKYQRLKSFLILRKCTINRKNDRDFNQSVYIYEYIYMNREKNIVSSFLI